MNIDLMRCFDEETQEEMNVVWDRLFSRVYCSFLTQFYG